MNNLIPIDTLEAIRLVSSIRTSRKDNPIGDPDGKRQDHQFTPNLSHPLQQEPSHIENPNSKGNNP